MKTLIKNAVVMQNDITLADNQYVEITDDIITYIGSNRPQGEYEEIDAKGDILMPGFVNAHTHLPMSLLRGVGEDLPLMEWLTTKIFPLEAKFTDEDIYYGTMAAMIDHIKGGQTSFVDMYYGIEAIAKAVHDSGVRALLSRCVAGTSLKETEVSRKQASDFVEKYKNDALIEPYYTIHAEYTCSDEVVKNVAEMALRDSVQIGVHLSETTSEHEGCKERHNGLSPAEYMNEMGVFDSRAVAAHCLWVEDSDIALLAKKNVTVGSCPTSNLKLASGIAPVVKMMNMGVNVAIGTDGASSSDLDMISELRLCALLQKGSNLDATIMPKEVPLKMACQNGAKLFNANIGVVETGAKADLILINTDNERFLPRSGLLSHLVYSSLGRDVRMTMVNGKVLYLDGVIRSFDEELIKKEFVRCMNRLYA